MDFRKLQAFCKVYEHLSFSKAGKELFLSQPTISAHVQGLEDELGVQLFDRLGRSVLPTGPAGVLYQAGVDVFRRLDLAKSEIDQIQNRIAGDINIGASTIPAHWVLPHLFVEFSNLYPAVSFGLRVKGTEAIIDKIASGQLDIGMVGAPTDRPGIVSIPVLEDEIVAVAQPGMAQRLIQTDLALEHWPWILRERNSGTRRVFEEALEKGGKRIGRSHPVVRLESTQGVLAFAVAGLGVGVLSRLAAGPDIKNGKLTVLDLGIPPITRHLYLMHLEGRSLLPAVQTFIKYASDHAESILEHKR